MDYKQQYIKMRNEGKYDINFFYHYYISKGGVMTNPQQFTQNFLNRLAPHPMIPNMMINEGERDKEAIKSHMDSVFGLTILMESEGKFIKVVE